MLFDCGFATGRSAVYAGQGARGPAASALAHTTYTNGWILSLS